MSVPPKRVAHGLLEHSPGKERLETLLPKNRLTDFVGSLAPSKLAELRIGLRVTLECETRERKRAKGD